MTGYLWRVDARNASDPVGTCLAAMTAVGLITDADAAMAAITEREDDSPTYVGNGIAMPHILGPAARRTALVVAPCHSVDWAGFETSLLIFVIAPALDLPDTDLPLDFMRRAAAISVEATSGAQAREHILALAEDLGAHVITQKGTTWDW